MTIMGKEVVIWNDGETDDKGKKVMGAWRCFEDACPHRLAPLSEGRVEKSGELLCAYHAWRFDGSGACTAIPHAEKDEEEGLCRDPKASCRAMPLEEIDGILWAWPETGADAALESLSRRPNRIRELEEEVPGVRRLHWNSKDLPYGWDYFCENVLDPAHVPVSHHGIVGDRYTGPSPLSLEIVRPLSTQGGFQMKVVTDNGEAEPGLVEFRPPCLVEIRQPLDNGSQLILCLYAVPTVPGYCRHIGCQVLVPNEAGEVPAGLAKMFALPLPHFLNATLGNLFLHQDMVFLHHQEKILAARGYEAKGGSTDDYLQNVYTPTEQDKGILTFRAWLRKRAGGGVPWPKGTRTELPPRLRTKELFDNYHTHVASCYKCLSALKNLRAWRFVSLAAAAVSVLLRTELGLVWAATGAAVFSGVGFALHKMIGLMMSYEFSHQNND